MRNPVRLKNWRLRFLPYYAIGALLVALARPTALGLAAGAALVAAGGALRAWGAGHLVKTRRLTLSGPYSRVRHPLYLGTLLVASGFAAMLGGWLGAGALCALLAWFFGVYFPRKERSESARLLEEYGEVYAAYRREVPALLPSLRPWSPAQELAAQASAESGWSAARYADNNELGTALALGAGIALLGLRAWVAA